MSGVPAGRGTPPEPRYNTALPALTKRTQAWLVVSLVLLLRLPFLNQAIQGDDFYYLKGAEHALVDPLHPGHARYVYQGEVVDMRGHPHPPLNAAWLGLIVSLTGSESELPLHAAYIPFSIIAGLSALSIARRYTCRPLMATILFLVTPAFVVNGNSLESDLPFVAFWLASVALFLSERWGLAALAGALAGLCAYQAVVLVPILGWMVWVERKRSVPAVIAALAAPVTILAWSVFERVTSGSLPATVLAGYMQTYNLQAFAQKLKNAAALTGHMAWLICPVLALMTFWRGPRWVRFVGFGVTIGAVLADRNPLFWISCGIGALVVLYCLRSLRGDFLSWWIAVFFAAALVIFFAGSQRYLLPVVLPVAILATHHLDGRWLRFGAAAQAVLSVGLAVVNYQHWDGYRQFARSIAPEIARHRSWTNAEWGFRHYLESAGAQPLVNGRELWAGDLLVTSHYGATPRTGPSAVIATREIRSAIPFRIVGIGVDSAYSSIAFGLAPFALSTAPIDRVSASLVSDRKAVLSQLTIGTPEAEAQIVSGLYNNDRWMAGRATVLLKRPPTATRIEAKVFIPAQAPARTVRLYADGKQIGEETLPGPGAHTVTAPLAGGDDSVSVTIEVDRTFSVPPDTRRLGVLLISIAAR